MNRFALSLLTLAVCTAFAGSLWAQERPRRVPRYDPPAEEDERPAPKPKPKEEPKPAPKADPKPPASSSSSSKPAAKPATKPAPADTTPGPTLETTHGEMSPPDRAFQRTQVRESEYGAAKLDAEKEKDWRIRQHNHIQAYKPELTGSPVELLGFRFRGYAAGRYDLGLHINEGANSFGVEAEGNIERELYAEDGLFSGMRVDVDQDGLEQGYAYLGTDGAPYLYLRVGKFDARVGIEHQDTINRRTISTGPLFAFGSPHNFTGVEFNFSPMRGKDGRFTVSGIFTNGWDSTTDNNRDKTFGTRMEFAGSTFAGGLFLMYGAERAGNTADKRLLADADIMLHAKDGSYAVGVEAQLGLEDDDREWGGFAALFHFAIKRDEELPVDKERFGFTGRLSWFDDDDGSRITIPFGNVVPHARVEIAVAANAQPITNFVFKGELRGVITNYDIFFRYNAEDAPDGFSIVLAVEVSYRF